MRMIMLGVAATLFLFGKCRKEDMVVQDFQPLGTGSNWTYTSNGSSFKLTVTGKDTLALGRSYKVLSNSNGANQYQSRSGSDYFRFATFQGILPNGVEELYLKADQNINATWQITIPILVSGVTVNITSKYTLSEKGISRTVQGKTYNDVIHVRQDFSSAFGNNGGGDHYYARGVGLISSSLSVIFPGQSITTNTELTAYEIR